MALLNLHCHSTYSDGSNSILELALAYKNSDHPSYFYLMMDGYETTNGGCYWGDEFVEKLKTFMPHPRRAYANQDVHALFDLGCICNEVSEDLIIKNELDLIEYLSVDKGE